MEFYDIAFSKRGCFSISSAILHRAVKGWETPRLELAQALKGGANMKFKLVLYWNYTI